MVDVELQRDMDAFLHELKAAPSSPQKHTSQSASEFADDATYFEATPHRHACDAHRAETALPSLHHEASDCARTRTRAQSC